MKHFSRVSYMYRYVFIYIFNFSFTINFRKYLLIQEAHRHPYLELLGKIYLMKLSYGKNFIDRAGYCYRLIFTLALMPWLRKHRTMARPKMLERDLSSQDEPCQPYRIGKDAACPTLSAVEFGFESLLNDFEDQNAGTQFWEKLKE